MTRQERFEIWAPAAIRWSPWVKPVLFAQMPDVDAAAPIPLTASAHWAPPVGIHQERWAIVIDLPGVAGVSTGLAVAGIGYRPVPLYNASPGFVPTYSGWPRVLNAVVPVEPIVSSLMVATPALKALALPYNAPPAFLLDAARRGPAERIDPGRFDNRSISFPTDFPSANVLLNDGISRVLVVHRLSHPQADLSHTLRRWQDAGIEIWSRDPDSATPAVRITIRKPWYFGRLWHGVLATFGLRRAPLGGFGGLVPHPSSG